MKAEIKIVRILKFSPLNIRYAETNTSTALTASILFKRRTRKSSDCGSVNKRPIIEKKAPTEKIYGIYINNEAIGLKTNPITATIIIIYPIA